MTRWTGVAAVVVCAVLLAGCGADDTAGARSSAPASEESVSEESGSLELSLPAAPTGRCMPPNVENLGAQDTAFEGTVTEVADGAATLQVTQMYTGAKAESVTVATASQGMSELVLAVDFQQGQTYLVSSLDGQVSVCGLSGPKDDFLSGLYQEAYAG